VDASNVIGTHLMEIIRRHSHELFSRQDAKKLLEPRRGRQSKLVEDVVPKLLSLAVLQRVLQNLLRERVSIRDAVSILEAVGEAGNVTRNPVLLTEYARQALGRAIVQPYLGPKGDLPAFFLDSSVEQTIESSVEHGEHSSQLNLAPQANPRNPGSGSRSGYRTWTGRRWWWLRRARVIPAPVARAIVQKCIRAFAQRDPARHEK